MAVRFGGIYDGVGEGHIRMKRLLAEAQRVHGEPDRDDYAVDLAFCTYPSNRRPSWIDP